MPIKNQPAMWETKICLVKTLVFPVVMYGCESWAIKKPESRRINADNWASVITVDFLKMYIYWEKSYDKPR